MPNAMTTKQTAGGTAAGTGGAGGQTAAPVKSFTRASMEHRELASVDKSVTMTASDQDLGAFPIPAYGYLRAIVLLVTSTGGAGASVFAADAPWSVLKNITIAEPNGAVVVQFPNGYDLYLAHKYGGYRGYNDPKAMPDYQTNVTGGTFTWLLRIPLEINPRAALAALPNQNSAAAFQLRATVAGTSQVYSTAPSPLPSIRVRAFAEEWDQPALASDGVANATTPPAMNTTQFISKQVYPVVAGANTIRFTRVGNYIRNLILTYRDVAGARVLNSSNNFPSLSQIFYDTRPFDTIVDAQWRATLYERFGWTGTVESAGALDNGVYPYGFHHDFSGRAGWELNDQWLPTLSSSRLELQGSFGVAGTLEVLTNDVSVAGNVFIT